MKRLLPIAVSLVVLAVIYWQIDAGGIVDVFRRAHLWWLAAALGMVVPTVLLTAWRLRWLVPRHKVLPFGEANRLILAACALNMVLPSKMGDVAKAYFMAQREYLRGSLALSLVVFEKACDLLALLAWGLVSMLLYPAKGALLWSAAGGLAAALVLLLVLLGSRRFARSAFGLALRTLPASAATRTERLYRSWRQMQTFFWEDRGHLLRIGGLSVLIWFLHLLQIWLFILALNAWAPFLDSLALISLALLAGLAPLTFAGVGTRDAALVVLFQPYFGAPVAAALGLLCTLRYLMPALSGLPFLNQYAAERVEASQI